jgi:hypothetical protein
MGTLGTRLTSGVFRSLLPAGKPVHPFQEIEGDLFQRLIFGYGLQLLAELVQPPEEEIHLLGLHRCAVLPVAIHQIFELVRQTGHLVVAHRAGHSFDRVQVTENFVDALLVVRLLLELDQLPLHVVQVLTGVAQKERFVFRHVHGKTGGASQRAASGEKPGPS